MRTNLFDVAATSGSVSLDATSLDSNDTSGSTGSISISTTDTDDLHLLRGAQITVYPHPDPATSPIHGSISSYSLTDERSLTVSAETALNLMNVERTIPPFVGTLSDAFNALGALVGLSFYVDPSLNTSVVWPGYRGNVWTYFKFALAYHDLLGTPDTGNSANIVTAHQPTQASYPHTPTGLSLSVSDPRLAKFVTVNYYNNTPITNGQVYPSGSWEDEQVFSVSPEEVFETELRINAWLSSVNQPVAADSIPSADYDASGTNGIYTVAGSDGLGVPASAWLSYGGRVVVELTDDPSVLKLTIRGPRRDAYTERIGTFSIAMTSGNLYSTLRITGTGVRFRQESVDIYTGTTSPLATEESGALVDNPFISSRAQAFDKGLRTAQSFCGPEQTYSATVDPVSDLVAELGKRFRHRDSVYRVTGVSQSGSEASVDAVADTKFSDFNARYNGMTFAQFNAANTGLQFGQFNTIPLRG